MCRDVCFRLQLVENQDNLYLRIERLFPRSHPLIMRLHRMTKGSDNRMNRLTAFIEKLRKPSTMSQVKSEWISMKEIHLNFIKRSYKDLPLLLEIQFRRLRNKCIRILNITVLTALVEQSPCDVKQLDTNKIIGPGFDTHHKEVQTGKGLFWTIKTFLEDAHDIWHPVILITCEGHVENNKLMVVFESQQLVADNIFARHLKMNAKLLMVFNCQTAKGTVMYSNALPDKIVSCRNKYVCDNAKALISTEHVGEKLPRPYDPQICV